MSKKTSQQILDEIYSFFKIMDETKVWSDYKDGVCVAWQHSDGYMRWYEENGQVKFQYICTDN